MGGDSLQSLTMGEGTSSPKRKPDGEAGASETAGPEL